MWRQRTKPHLMLVWRACIRNDICCPQRILLPNKKLQRLCKWPAWLVHCTLTINTDLFDIAFRFIRLVLIRNVDNFVLSIYSVRDKSSQICCAYAFVICELWRPFRQEERPDGLIKPLISNHILQEVPTRTWFCANSAKTNLLVHTISKSKCFIWCEKVVKTRS